MRSEEKGRYEMVWDCPGCGTTGLLGLTHRHCPSCGAPQDPTRRYFPPEGEEVAVEDHPYQGADVLCAACDTPNAARADFCVGCGSPLDGAKAVRTRAAQSAAGGFAADSAANAAREAEEARQAERRAAMQKHALASGGAAPPRSGGRLWKVLGGLGCLAVATLAVAAVVVFFFWKKDAAVVVTGHTWERTVAIETFGPERGTAWRDSLPAGAYGVSCRQEQRSTKKVPDGETCTDKRQDKGDGTFAVVQECVPRYREEPVYADRCSYTVDTWQVSKTERAAGTGLTPAPAWPAVTLARAGNCLGCQREGARKQVYTVSLTDEATKAAHRCDLPEATWRAMAAGSRWTSQVGVVSGALDCEALAPL